MLNEKVKPETKEVLDTTKALLTEKYAGTYRNTNHARLPIKPDGEYTMT